MVGDKWKDSREAASPAVSWCRALLLKQFGSWQDKDSHHNPRLHFYSSQVVAGLQLQHSLLPHEELLSLKTRIRRHIIAKQREKTQAISCCSGIKWNLSTTAKGQTQFINSCTPEWDHGLYHPVAVTAGLFLFSLSISYIADRKEEASVLVYILEYESFLRGFLVLIRMSHTVGNLSARWRKCRRGGKKAWRKQQQRSE